MDLLSIERLGDLLRVLNLCLDPINTKLVLLIFNVNLFATSHSLTLPRSRFRTSLIVSGQALHRLSEYHLHIFVVQSLEDNLVDH